MTGNKPAARANPRRPIGLISALSFISSPLLFAVAALCNTSEWHPAHPYLQEFDLALGIMQTMGRSSDGDLGGASNRPP
jgi:hypothetical protein